MEDACAGINHAELSKDTRQHARLWGIQPAEVLKVRHLRPLSNDTYRRAVCVFDSWAEQRGPISELLAASTVRVTLPLLSPSVSPPDTRDSRDSPVASI